MNRLEKEIAKNLLYLYYLFVFIIGKTYKRQILRFLKPAPLIV